jgi:hypothetical protein
LLNHFFVFFHFFFTKTHFTAFKNLKNSFLCTNLEGTFIMSLPSVPE